MTVCFKTTFFHKKFVSEACTRYIALIFILILQKIGEKDKLTTDLQVFLF